jgi:hypothetical protein
MGTTPIVFDYNAWAAMFPEMGGVSSAAALGYFNLATMFVRNDGRGPVDDEVKLQNLLFLATAHVARLLSNRTNGVSVTGGAEPAPPIVGRITTASEGSVSVAADMPNQSMNAEWWQQTPYGAMVWMALLPNRVGPRIVPNPRRRIYNPPRRYLGGNFGYW